MINWKKRLKKDKSKAGKKNGKKQRKRTWGKVAKVIKE